MNRRAFMLLVIPVSIGLLVGKVEASPPVVHHTAELYDHIKNIYDEEVMMDSEEYMGGKI